MFCACQRGDEVSVESFLRLLTGRTLPGTPPSKVSEPGTDLYMISFQEPVLLKVIILLLCCPVHGVCDGALKIRRQLKRNPKRPTAADSRISFFRYDPAAFPAPTADETDSIVLDTVCMKRRYHGIYQVLHRQSVQRFV